MRSLLFIGVLLLSEGGYSHLFALLQGKPMGSPIPRRHRGVTRVKPNPKNGQTAPRQSDNTLCDPVEESQGRGSDKKGQPEGASPARSGDNKRSAKEKGSGRADERSAESTADQKGPDRTP